MSAGFGGVSFRDAFAAAAPGSRVESQATTLLFRDPIGGTREQIDKAIGFHATTVVALDLLFWDLYGGTDPAWRDSALASGLAELERARASGAWIIVGDVPHVVTAADWMLPKEQVPDATTLAAANTKIAAWAHRDRVLFVPLAAWAEPLASGASIALSPTERVPAAAFVAVDGFHPNELGVWYLLDHLDHLIETTLPGTSKTALVFRRPAAAASR